MQPEIICERKYPPIILTKAPIDSGTAGKTKPIVPAFDKILNQVYIPIPERIKASAAFIQIAIKLSEQYELDTTIERHDTHITVRYSFDCCGGIRGIAQILGMVDEFAFFKDLYGKDITVSMDYYTHIIARGNTVVAP